MPRKGQDTGRSANDRIVFVDSSAWIALFSRRDQRHEEADRMFRSAVASKTPLLTTNLVVAEIHRLLLHRAGSTAAAAALDKIEASPLVRMEFAGPIHHRTARSWLRKLSMHPISYADAVSFAAMESSGCTKAISFDRHFQLAGFYLYA